MDIWEILGIAYTLDISSIQEAYKARAGEIDPEENPKEFRQLQKAYQAAYEYAVYMMSQPPIYRPDVSDTESGREEHRQNVLNPAYIEQQKSIRSAQEEPRREKILRALRVPAIIVVLLFCVVGMYLSESEIVLTPIGAAVLLYYVMRQIGSPRE